MQTTGRLFYALWPNEDVARQLAQRQAPIDGGRKSHARDFHLTLAFLGVQPPHLLPGLVQTVDEIEFNPLDFILDRYGSFERQKVVWAGMSQVPQGLVRLRQRLLEMPALAQLDYRREARFVPHVTLARKALMPQVAFESISWRSPCLALAESAGEGVVPRYRLLACRDAGPELP